MRLWVPAILVALCIPATATAGTVFLLDGRGWGHGVGMSQWGAEGYARHGSTYRQILAHYYPHTHIGIATPRDIRVLLVRAKPRIRVGSAAPFALVDAQERKAHLPAGSVVVDAAFLKRHPKLALPFTFEPGAQPLTVGGAGYRGEVEVTQKPGGFMAVNLVGLDLYLRGVVPSEAPGGWHEQTYEAQAVAARSYTLAMIHPADDFDLYPDQRSQVYGGIAAETTATNLAIGATAGQVLVWRDQIIPAYYFSSSGGKTSSVHDAWPKMKQVPYLVSVADPYDYIAPHHVWPTQVLTPETVESTLGVADATDMRVVVNSSGRAKAVRVRTSSGWRVFSGNTIRTKFALGSTDFTIGAMSLDAPSRTLFGTQVEVTGFVRGLGRARLEQLTPEGWRTLRPVHVDPRGRFSVQLDPKRSTQLRLAYNDVVGDAVPVNVAPRVTLQASGPRVAAQVTPWLPFQLERLIGKKWRTIARSDRPFDRLVAPGSYRVATAPDAGYVPALSRAVSVHVSVIGP
jgi:stage II sporulation protein D